MAEDEARIRQLIEDWVRAVQARDLDVAVADRTDDIAMFDVSLPFEGVRGTVDYRDTYRPFFEWLERGAVFELRSLEVTAGADVAYAHALLRCAQPEEIAKNPDLRLRLTLGLRKENGRWLVAHEHHSFPLAAQEGDAA